MSYNYFVKNAVKMDLFGGWRTIVTNTRKAEDKALKALLEQAVKYFYSEGLILDPAKSELSVREQASDGYRLVGYLHITEAHNNIEATTAMVEEWTEAACGLRGHAEYIGSGGQHQSYNRKLGMWMVDISDY